MSLFKGYDSSLKEVIRGAGITFLIKMIGASLVFIFNILLARKVGAEAVGVYFLAITIIIICATVARFGLENTLLRVVSSSIEGNNWGAVKGVVSLSIKLSLSISLILSAMLFILSPWLSIHVFNKPGLADPLRIMAMAITPFSLYWLISEALRGMGKVRDSQLLQGLLSPFILLIGLITVGRDVSINYISVLYVVTSIAVLLVAYLMWKYHIRKHWRVTASYSYHNLFESCIPLFWVQMIYLIISFTSVFILGIIGTSVDVGVFSAAQKISLLISFVLISVNSVVAQKYAAFYVRGDLEGIETLARQSGKILVLVASPILLVLIVMSTELMSMYGEDFSHGGTVLAILAAGQFINILTGSVGYILMMTGNERSMRNNTFAAGIFTIFVNLVFVPWLGLLGAGIATSLSVAFLNLGALYLVWKKLNIFVFPFRIKI